MEDKKIELAPQDEVELLEPYVDKILEALGHPEALVTDESDIGDFLCFCVEEEATKELKEASIKLGMSLNRKDTIVSIARRLKGE